MGYIDWTESLSVGLPDIDAQHRRLIGLINRLDEARRLPGRESAREALAELGAYAAVHFAAEEGLFEACAYPGARAHKEEHRAFVARIGGLSAGLASPGAGDEGEAAEEILSYLKTWLTRHIAFSDRKYRPYLRG